MRRNQRIDNFIDIAAGKVMRFQLIHLHIEPCLIGLDERQDDLCRRHTPHPHADECDDADVDVSSKCRNP